MSAQRNIVILGASFSGLGSTHYILRHIIPALKKREPDVKYHLYVIDQSTDWYFRIGAPRATVSPTALPQEKLFIPISDVLKPYSTDDYTFIHASATSLDTESRNVVFKRHGSNTEESLPYHALIVATGSRTNHPAFSLHGDSQTTKNAIKELNAKVNVAHDIVVVGGGPTGVETAGELGEYLNGKPGCFTTPVEKANITLITADAQLLPVLRPAIGAEAETKLRKLGVKVLYNTRVSDATTSADGSKTILTLSKGEKLEADLYIPAYGVLPNTSFLPQSLLDEKNYLKTNPQTLRVDAAGPRVYGLGDVGSYSRNNALDIQSGMTALMVNLKRDLFAFSSVTGGVPGGKDRVHEPVTKETQLVPVGSGGGVAALFGWRVPSFVVWMFKARDYMVGMGIPQTRDGTQLKKEFPWTSAEAVV